MQTASFACGRCRKQFCSQHAIKPATHLRDGGHAYYRHLGVNTPTRSEGVRTFKTAVRAQAFWIEPVPMCVDCRLDRAADHETRVAAYVWPDDPFERALLEFAEGFQHSGQIAGLSFAGLIQNWLRIASEYGLPPQDPWQFYVDNSSVVSVFANGSYALDGNAAKWPPDNQPASLRLFAAMSFVLGTSPNGEWHGEHIPPALRPALSSRYNSQQDSLVAPAAAEAEAAETPAAPAEKERSEKSLGFKLWMCALGVAAIAVLSAVLLAYANTHRVGPPGALSMFAGTVCSIFFTLVIMVTAALFVWNHFRPRVLYKVDKLKSQVKERWKAFKEELES